jgi:hypothetical protein
VSATPATVFGSCASRAGSLWVENPTGGEPTSGADEALAAALAETLGLGLAAAGVAGATETDAAGVAEAIAADGGAVALGEGATEMLGVESGLADVAASDAGPGDDVGVEPAQPATTSENRRVAAMRLIWPVMRFRSLPTGS